LLMFWEWYKVVYWVLGFFPFISFLSFITA
jgi:hypothetical protein